MTLRLRLGDVGTTYGGLTGKTKVDFGHGDARYVTFLEVINSTRLRGRELNAVRVAKNEKQNHVLRGDVLFNGSSETPEEVALSAVVDFEPDTSIFLNSFCFGFRLRPGAPVDPTYLAYFFRSPTGRSLVAALAQGATRYNIAKTKLLDLEFSIPPLERQHEIVEALSNADDWIATLERLITKKEAVKYGAMRQLLTGSTRLPSFTEEWENGVFEQLASPMTERVMPESVDPATVLIELDQIEGRSGRLLSKCQASDATSLKAVFRSGDVLFGRLRAYLRKFWHADIAGLCTTEIWVLRPRDGVDGRFVRYLVETDDFVEAASTTYGTHMPRSDWGVVKNFPVRIPPLAEQKAIAKSLSDADDEIHQLHDKLNKAHLVKRAMMQELITGRTRLPVEENVS